MDERLLRKAEKKVEAKKQFFTHSFIMLAAGIFITALSFIVTPGNNWWVLIPLGAMALSVVIHYLSVFGFSGTREKLENWEAEELQNEYLKLKEMEELKKGLLDEDGLRLRQLENRYRDEDFV